MIRCVANLSALPTWQDRHSAARCVRSAVGYMPLLEVVAIAAAWRCGSRSSVRRRRGRPRSRRRRRARISRRAAPPARCRHGSRGRLSRDCGRDAQVLRRSCAPCALNSAWKALACASSCDQVTYSFSSAPELDWAAAQRHGTPRRRSWPRPRCLSLDWSGSGCRGRAQREQRASGSACHGRRAAAIHGGRASARRLS